MTSTTSAQAAAKLAAKLFARTAAAPRRANARVAAGTQSPAKFMTAAWLTLAVAASVLLAVALPEPAPVAAQNPPAASPYNLTVAPASGTDSAADLSVNYSLTRRNCDDMANPVADFTQASGTEVMENGQATGAKIHQLNWRCDWRVSVCGAPMDIVYGDGTKETQQPGVFWLSKDTTGERLVHGGYGKTVTRLEFGVEPFGCDTTELQVRSGQRNEHDISILRSGVFFVLVPVNCGTGTGGRQVSAAPVTVRDYSGILDSGEVGQYALDSRCGWRFYACDIPNTPSIQFYDLAGNRNVGSAASPTAMDVELRRHSSGKWGRGGSAFDFMVFNMPSVDISNQPVAANLNRCPAAHAQATATVRVGRAAGVDTFAGLDYELAPVNCVFNDPATAPPPAQTNATTGTGGNTDTFKTHQLDARCDWLVRFCGSAVQVGNRASDGMVTEHATLAHGETFLLAKQLSNRALAYPGSAQSDKTANYFEVSEELGCADTEVQVAAATGVSAKAVLGVDYSLVPSACRNVNAGGVALTGGATLTLTTQTRLSGFPASGGALAHKLDVRCDWNIQFCTAGAKVGAATPGEATPFGTVATAGEAFKLDGYLQRGFSGTTLRLQYEAATAAGDRTKAVDRLWLTSPSAMACPKSASSVPSVALTPNGTAAGNDTGSSATDGITSNKNPTFTVTGVAANSTVTVTATNGTDTVSRTYSGAEVSGTSLQAEFSDTDDECDTEDAGTTADESCDLTPDGTWTITATHTQSSNHDPANSAAPHTMVTVDTADPTITVAVAPTATAKPQADMRTVTVTSGGARNSETLAVVYLTQASSTCDASVPATGTTAYMQAVEFDAAADSDQYFCAWVSDVAGNTASGVVQIPPIDDVHPTVTIAAPNGATTLNTNDTVALTFTLSDSTTDFAATDISVANTGGAAATLDNASFSGSGTSYTINLMTGANGGTATITAAANAFEDAAGNDSLEATLALTVQAGSSQPTLALKTGAGGSKTGSSLTATNDTTPTFTVSNVVAGASVTLTYEKSGTAAVTTPAATVAANTTSVDITLPTLAANAGDWTVKATHTEPSKAATDSADFTLTVDTIRPTVTVTLDSDSLTVGTNPSTTARFMTSETTTDFALADVGNPGNNAATLSNFSGSGSSYTATLTIVSTVTSTSRRVLSVPQNQFHDAAGNSNTASSHIFFSVNPQPASAKPTITLHTDSRGADDTTTTDTTPKFAVTGVAANSKLTVSATKDTIELSKPEVTVPGSVPSGGVEVEFSGSDCTKVTTPTDGTSPTTETGQSCTLALGRWNVTAAHTDGNNAETDSDALRLVVTEASPKPTLALDDDSNSGSDADNITNNVNPRFIIGNVTGGGTVELTLTDGTTTITKRGSVGGSNPGESIELDVSGSNCGPQQNTACGSLTHGAWTVTVTHDADGFSNPAKSSTDSDPLSLTIDTQAPDNLVITPNPANGTPTTSKTYTATDNDAETTTWVRQLLETGSTCATSPPTAVTSNPTTYQAQNYTESPTAATVTVADDADNNKTLCFWATDVAGNTASAKVTIADVDTTGPVVTITTAAAFTVNAASEVRFAFNEAPTGFEEADISVSDTTKLTLVANSLAQVGSTNTYTANFRGVAIGTGIVISLPASKVTDALNNNNPGPNTSANPATGTLTVSVSAQLPSDPITSLTYDGSDTGSSTTDKITNDNSPSFTASPVTAGADVTVTAAQGNVTLAKTMEVGASKTTETVTFSGSDCTKVTTPVGGGNPTTETGQSCALGDGTWSFTATHDQANRTPSTYTPATALEVTIDTADPTVTFTFAPTMSAMPRSQQRELTIAASDTSGATPTVVFVKQDAACPAAGTALTSPAAYSGAQTYSSEADSGDYICVDATDTAGNSARASVQIPVIDTSAPPVTATLVSSSATQEQKFRASTTETGLGTLTWHSASAFIAGSAACATAVPGNAHTYAPGQDAQLTATTETSNGMKMCFWATDQAGNVGSGFVLVANVDRTGPTVTVRVEPASVKINTNTAKVWFTTGEPVTGFDDLDMDIDTANGGTPGANASLSGFAAHTDTTNHPNTWTANLTAGATLGTFTVTVKTGVLTDALGNPNAASTGTNGANGQLEITIRDLDPSAALDNLGINEDDTNDTGSEDDDGITSDNTPGFEISSSALVAGATIRVTASKSGSSDTVTKSTASGSNPAADGVTLVFNASNCETSDGATTQTGQSCALGDGTWTFTVTQTESGKGESAAYPTTNPPSLTIDTMDPPVTAVLVSSTPTMEQKFRASTTETGTIAWKSASSFIASSATCASRPPSNADDYTPGTDADKTSIAEADDGMKMCFWATDLAGNTGVADVVVDHVDRSAPIVSIVGPASGAATFKEVIASDSDDNTNSPTTWKYKVIPPTVPPTTLACPTTAPADATAYTEYVSGQTNSAATVTITDESANGGIVCFWSEDAAGNVGVGKSDEIAGIDTTPPEIVITAPSSVVKDGTATITFTVTDKSTTFTEFDAAADITVTGSGGSITSAPSLKMGETHVYEATFTAGSMSGVSVMLQVAANKLEDAAQNGNNASNTVTIDIVETQPSRTPAVALAAASDTGTGAGANDGRYTSEDEPTFTVTFPGSSTYTITNSTIKVTATKQGSTDTVSKTVTATSGASVDVAFTGTTGCDTGDDATTTDDPCMLGAGDWKIKAAHTDTGASHSEAESAEIDVTVITVAEAVTLTASSSALDVASSTAGDIAGKTATLTFTVPASYAGPSDSALTVASIVTMTGSIGSLGAWSRSGNTYTATFTPSGLGTASFTVAANALMDLAGNNNPALVSAVPIAVRVGPRPLILRNLAAAGNSSDRNYDLKVTPKTSSSSCANAGARDTEYTLAAGAEVTIAVGQDSGEFVICNWTFEFAAAGSDCAVSSWQFKESGHADDNASQGHGDTTKASPTEPVSVSVSSGIYVQTGSGNATIDRAVFDVVCPTEFDAMLEVAVTDPMSADLTGINIRVIVEETASQAAGCEVPSGSSGIDVSLGAAAANPYTTPVPGSLVDKLVDASSRMLAADADRCTYTARFPNFINGPGSPPAYRLVRTSAREVTFSNADANSRKATADYRVLRTAVLALTNDTTAGHASATTRRDVSVTVTPGTGCSETAPQGSPFAVASGASGATAVEIDFGTADCAWDLTFTNTADDCRVFAQRQEMYTGASVQSPVNNSDGALTVHVINRWVRTGPVTASENPELASIKFTVPDPDDSTASPAGVCNTNLAGAMIEIEVDDSDSGTHTGTDFVVEVANGVRSDAGNSDAGTAPCSQNITDITLSLGAPTGAKSTVLHTVTGLIGTLHDGATCSYEVTFPPSVTSVGSDPAAADADDVPLVRQGSATATLSASTKVSRTYDATRAATVLLQNATGSSDPAHVLDNMEHVVARVNKAGTCSATVPAELETTYTLDTAANKSLTAGLGTPNCLWIIGFNNPGFTCQVSAQPLKEDTNSDPSDDAVGAPVVDDNGGGVALVVFEGRVYRREVGSPGDRSADEVVKVEFTVTDNCISYFDGVVELTVKDTSEVTHDGSIRVQVTPVLPVSNLDENCSQPPDIEVDLSMAATTRDGRVFTGMAENLIDDNPFDALDRVLNCEYTVTFLTEPMVDGVSFTLLGTATTAKISETSKTVARTYDAVRPALLALHNGTGTSVAEHVLPNMEQVGLRWILNDNRPACAGGTAPLTLAAGASAPSPVDLGTDDCRWEFTFANGPHAALLKNCRVEAQLQGVGPGYVDLVGAENTKTTTSTATPSTNNNGSFSLWVRGHRVFNQAAGGAEVGRVEFEVTNSCTTYFPRAVLVSTTNAPGVIGTHTGTMIDVTVSQRDKPQSPRAACSAAAAGVTETITLDAAGSGQATFMNLVNKPLGQDDCEYEASFETGVASGSLRLNRTSTDPVDFDADTAAAATAVAATYRAVSSAGIKLKNVTLKTSTHPLTTMRDVVVTVTPTPSSTCTATAPSGSPFTLAAVAGQDEQDVSLGTQECVWTLTFSNRNSDCLATAQFRNASAGTEGSLQEPASLTGGSVTVNVDANRTTRIGSTIGSGAVVASIDFDVPTTSCDTLFDAEVSLSVTDTANPTNPGVHAGTVFPVEVRQSGALARCSADQTGNDALMLTLKADGTAEEEFKLVNRPYGASADCRYSVSFPASRNSAVSGATVALVTTGTAGVLRAGAASVSAEYDAVRPATLDLENVTAASLTSASRGTVQVTLTPSLCSGAGTAPTTITRTLGAAGGSGATMEADLGTQNCTWTAAFGNPQRDCAIAARLTDSTDADINSSRVTANNGAGSLVFYTQGRRARLTNTANGTVLSKAKFAVSATCATTFSGTVAVMVSDRNAQARHTGTAFGVTVAPAGAAASGCSPSQNLTVTLSQALSGSTPVNNLVGTPLGGQACSYTVTYTDAVKVSAVDSTIQLERPSAFTATIRDGNAQARTASITYTAVRAATVLLQNATPSSTVQLTPASASTCVASKTAQFELTSAASSETVSLGTQPCFWTIGFANVGDNCKVEARLKNTSGGNINSTPITSKPNAGSITLHVSSDRRVMSAASGGVEVGSVEFAVTADCDTSFDATVSISATDTLEASISNRIHTGTRLDVSVSSSGAGCSASASRQVTLSAQNAATASFTGLRNTPAGGSACSYRVSFPGSVNSATNSRVRLVSANTGSVTLSGSATSAALTYTAELIPVPVVVQAVSVSAAPPVTEGQPLLFPVGLPRPAAQAVQVSYTISGLPGSDSGSTGTATIAAGQRSGVISVPTEDDQRDSADLTVRVTLTGATGGVPIDQFGRSATGIVRDDDPAPTVGIKAAAAIGDELRFTLELSARSARDVRVSYTTSLGGRGTVVIDAGELEASAQRLFDPVQLSRGEGLLLRLTSAQNATIDTSARERLLSSAGGVAWRFHVTGRAGVTPAQIAAAFGLSAGWKLYSWDTQFQRWTPHTATAGGRAALPRGATITFRGAEPEEEQLDQAGLAPTSSVTLRRGWNIFTPAPDAIGLEAGDFTRTSAGNSAVIFDPRLIGCANLAGVLVIYTYDQSDPGAANGFRIALPCHPQVQADAGIPAIESIDSNDTIYAWFNSTTPATLAFRNGRYTPA